MDPSSQMAGSLNPLDASARIQDLEYLYASTVNFSNFVSVKLSSDRNYHLWKTQMLCLMKSHTMAGIVDDAYASPRASSKEIKDQYDNLLKGWIFGSASEDVLDAVIHLNSAKEAWNKLKTFFDVTISHQQAPTKSEGETKAEAKAQAETETETETKNINGGDAIAIEVESTKTETEGEAANKNKKENKKNLHEAAMKGDWSKAKSILEDNKNLVKEVISSDGSTVLHIAVGIGHNDFVKKLFSYINSDKDILQKRKPDGSTALHIAAIVGNKNAAELLVKKNKSLLQITDKKGKEPLHKAYENMHLETIGYLLKAIVDHENEKIVQSPVPQMQPDDTIGVDLLVNAISAQEYNLASELIRKFPKFASKSDKVLMAIAKSFPSGDYERTYIPLSWKDLWKVPVMLLEVFMLICGLILLPSLSLSYILTWISRIIVEPITHTEKKKKEMDEAEKVLKKVCDQIDKLKVTGVDYHPYYTSPILEAACQNAHRVVDEILYRSPKAIQSTDKSGYDIIQLAVIHRSERIYNLIYDIGERKNLYRTIVDSSKNNILHLAGRLAPSHVLNHTAGAALQLQRELQWREEVKKVVFPTYITQENIFKETPDMVFTKEHANLVKDGEQWLKTTAESCSISAGLIITIVFAAAITVPGGSNQETGIPLFRQDIAFVIFAVSDAISLFASSTALLVFLSILTSRFAEKDFLLSLPRRLLIDSFPFNTSVIPIYKDAKTSLHKVAWSIQLYTYEPYYLIDLDAPFTWTDCVVRPPPMGCGLEFACT
ncbi:ankyrin repeat-containing domain-containing LTR copia-type protein [Tanacetum coccineum]